LVEILLITHQLYKPLPTPLPQRSGTKKRHYRTSSQPIQRFSRDPRLDPALVSDSHSLLSTA